MAQLFHPAANVVAKAGIFGAVFFLALGAWLWGRVYRSAYVTGAGVARPQPVPFSHKHHVAGVGIDCRYCHTSVEEGPFAGIPAVKTCMHCHSQIWADSPVLEPVRESFRSGLPIAWTRVHDLPDFAYFDHSIHVAKGIGCVTCHGRVDEMPLTWKTHTLFMEWCLECHRHPENYVRPREAVFDPAWETPPGMGARLVKEYDIKSKTNCSFCHR
ncbi:MAG: cytochrome c3 family protein [Planctomycetes bacterium]|nr:cytochrome c3 family protein [Planctomycetota bacterium]